jgi:hypothetical protein
MGLNMDQAESLLRSAYQIAQRKGKKTNWGAFERNLLAELGKELWKNDELDDQDILRATCTPLTYGVFDEDEIDIETQMKAIPADIYKANRYNTDNNLVIHLWNEIDEKSYDIRVPKHT